jgi:glycosyltransferase involved in cell wall biosynthesis
MPKISTAIIACNEERNIERCLKSVAPFSDEIVVVDSHSTDRTVAIARAMGARVISNDWHGYGKQRQFALDHARHEWIFSIDADEEVSRELCDEIRALDYSHDGYEVPRPVWYLNRWIKHGVWYPGHVLRLFRKDKARVSNDVIHESVLVSGRIARLRGDLLHYSYRNIEHHLDKMNEFTSISAGAMRSRSQHASVPRIVLYPMFEFFKTYVVKRGFLDGLPGFEISVLHALYVFLKYAKLREADALSKKPPAAAQ